jgi:hypothetical protein
VRTDTGRPAGPLTCCAQTSPCANRSPCPAPGAQARGIHSPQLAPTPTQTRAHTLADTVPRPSQGQTLGQPGGDWKFHSGLVSTNTVWRQLQRRVGAHGGQWWGPHPTPPRLALPSRRHCPEVSSGIFHVMEKLRAGRGEVVLWGQDSPSQASQPGAMFSLLLEGASVFLEAHLLQGVFPTSLHPIFQPPGPVLITERHPHRLHQGAALSQPCCLPGAQYRSGGISRCVC